MPKLRRRNGFTLIEITIATTLLTILLAFGISASMNSYRQYAFFTNKTILITVLQNARRMALDNVDQTSHGVHVSSLDATLFHGANYISGDQTNIIFPFNVPVTVLGTPNIVFDQLTGNTVSTTVTIVDGMRQITVRTNHEGMLDW